VSAAAGRRLLFAGLALAVALPVALDLLIETDEERVAATLDGLDAGLEARDADAVLAWCAPEVALRTGLPWLPTRTGFAAALRTSLARVTELRLQREPAQFESHPDGGFRVVMSGSAFAVVSRLGGGPFRLDLTVQLTESAAGTLELAAVEALAVSPRLR